MTVRLLLAPVLVAALAVGAPARADVAREEVRAEARTRTLMLGLAAVGALALAARAAERREDRAEDDEAARSLPAACLRAFRPRARGEDARLLFDPACLEEAVERSDELPLGCAVTLRTWAGFETGLDPGCLAEDGWETVRARG